MYIVIATVQWDVSNTYFNGAIFLGCAPFLGAEGTPGAGTMLKTFLDLDAWLEVMARVRSYPGGSDTIEADNQHDRQKGQHSGILGGGGEKRKER